VADQREGGISWTEQTWNPIRGCSRASEECLLCYAQFIAARFSGPGHPYEGLAKTTSKGANWTGVVRFIEEHLLDPLRWKRPRRVFVNSMSDLFHEDLPKPVIDLIVAVMALADQHTFQVLTKRVDRMRQYLTDPDLHARLVMAESLVRSSAAAAGVKVKAGKVMAWPLPNVWWGMSAGNQKWFDDRYPDLQACRPHAAILWLSAEPLIGPLSLKMAKPFLAHLGAAPVACTHGFDACPTCDAGIDWVVAGGESKNQGADSPIDPRPMMPHWVRLLRDQCAAAHVPFHFKQWGDWGPVTAYQIGDRPKAEHVQTDTYSVHQVQTDTLIYLHETMNTVGGHYAMARVGKKAAGRKLDGQTHDAYPAMQPAA
jgi:protein gp37